MSRHLTLKFFFYFCRFQLKITNAELQHPHTHTNHPTVIWGVIMWYCVPGGNAALNWDYGETLELREQKKLKCEHLIHPSNQILSWDSSFSAKKQTVLQSDILAPSVLYCAVHHRFKIYRFFLARHWSAWELKRHNDEERTKNGSQIQGQSSWFDTLSNQKSNPALLHSAHSVSRNPALRYEIALHTPIQSEFSNITLCSILPPVTEACTASFLKGIHIRWANLAAGWISFIRAQHKGIRCNVPARSFL